MCNKAVRYYLFSFQFVPDWLVTQQQIDVCYDGGYVYNDNEMIKWYDGYKSRKAQNAKIWRSFYPSSGIPIV